MNKKLLLEIVAVVGVVMLAASFRFYDIKHYPPGLYPDEAANGEDVLSIFHGDVRPFYERGNGREALFFYIQAAFVKTFGVGVWPMHAASALVGTLTVLALYFAVRPFFGRLAAFMAALLLATNQWHVTLSRTGFRAIMVPLFVAAFTALTGATVIAVKTKRLPASYVYAVLAGVAFAGGFYTYIAYRIMIGVVLGVLALLLLAAAHPKIGFPHFRRYGYQIIVAIAAAIVVIAPLAWYFINHPSAFAGRAGQVSVFNPDLQRQFGGGTLAGTVWYSFQGTVGSFFLPPGDVNWRHNVAGYPLLNPLVGFLGLLGLAWTLQGTWTALREIVRGQEVHLYMIYPYILLLLSGMLVPVITTAEGIPHGLRSTGLIVPIFMLAGTAGSVLIYWCKRKLQGVPQAAVIGTIVGGLVVAGIYDGMLYFLVARNDSQAAYAYRADLTDVAAYLNTYANQHPQAPRPYLVLDAYSVQTVHYLTAPTNNFWDQLDPATSQLTPLAPGQSIVFTQSTIPDADRYKNTYSQVIELVESRRNRFHQEIMRVYQARSADGTKSPEQFDLDAT